MISPRLAIAFVLLHGTIAAAQTNSAFSGVLSEPPTFSIESINLRFTHYDQWGHGYQSQANTPPNGPGPGSERLTVEEPQLEIVAKQGERMSYRIWVPVDAVTAASPDASDARRAANGATLDAVSTASRVNNAASLDVDGTYQLDHRSTLSVRAGAHVEAILRSWNLGLGYTRSFADDNATLSVSVNQIADWFDAFDHFGVRRGRIFRSSTNGNIGLSQLLSPTTVAALNYGLTVQSGTLSNTWNAVPIRGGGFSDEFVPHLRQRHALVGRLSQWLPWHGALKLFYRFYADDWGVRAHSVEVELHQRVTSFLRLRINYRVHYQNGVDFFTSSADASTTLPMGDGSPAYRTADSDLQRFVAQTAGGYASFDLGFVRILKQLHFDLSYERYFRSNDLRVNMYTCGLGFRF